MKRLVLEAGFDLDRLRCLAEFDPTPEMLALQERTVKRLTLFTRRQCCACITACPIRQRLARTYWDGE